MFSFRECRAFSRRFDRACVSIGDLLATLPDRPAQVLCIDSDWPDIATQPTTYKSSGAIGDNAA